MTLEGDIEMTSGRFSHRFASNCQIHPADTPDVIQQQLQPVSACILHPEREQRAERLCRLLPDSVRNCRNIYYIYY